MTRLSVNINKFATIRNARGGNNPNVLKVAIDCEKFGAEGITVHPRPDERHITYQDVMSLKDTVTTEFNIEGYPDDRFLELIEKSKPTQVTLVPDGPDILTSNAGWNTLKNKSFLTEVLLELKKHTERVSLFVDPVNEQVEGAANVGAERIELYTAPYAAHFQSNSEEAIAPYIEAAITAQKLDIGINAGHDLDLNNLFYLKKNIPSLAEVSIGHALVCDALYFGLENTIQMYLLELNR